MYNFNKKIIFTSTSYKKKKIFKHELISIYLYLLHLKHYLIIL